jgi:ribosomal protein S27E
MSWIFATRIRKITNLIATLSIISITFLALFPCISVTESTDSGEIVTVYNLAMMEKNTNSQIILNLAGDLDITMLFLWVVTIFAIVSFVGIILYVSEKYSFLAKLLMLLGCSNMIFNVIAVFLLRNWTINIEGINGFSLSLIASTPISYIHLTMLIIIISFISSIFYTCFVVYFFIKRIPVLLKQKKKPEEQTDKKPATTDQLYNKEKQRIMRDIQALEKQTPPKEVKSFEKPSTSEFISEDKKELLGETEKPSTPKPPFKIDKPHSEEKTTETPQSETLDEKETGEMPTSSMFEQALTSAIKKRQPDTQKKEENKQPEKEKINVKCPDCENVFTVEKTGDVLKIKCPKCGKEGVTKQ